MSQDMFHDLRSRKSFPLIVFLALLVVAESAILLAASLARPPDITAQHGTSTPAADDRTDSRRIDEFMTETLRRMGVPGAAVAVVRDGRILHTAGYGRRSDGSLMTAGTLLPVASLTKSFTAAAIMMLVEEGTLALDAPVTSYLPEFELADPRGVRITIKQLMNQSSGLAPRSLPPRPDVLPRSLDEQIGWLRRATLVNEPGAAFNYCNDNYNVLALVIERVSGIPFPQFLRDRLFVPLDMNDSRLHLTMGEPMPGVAAGQLLVYGVPVGQMMRDEFMAGAGGIVSTANDVARWLVFQNTGGRMRTGQPLLSPASMAAMHTPSVAGSRYAFGWEQESLPDGTVAVEHSGKAPPYVAHQQLLPDGYAYALVLNGSHSFNAEAASFITGMHELVAGRTPAIGPPFILLGVPFGSLADHVLAILTVAALTIGVVGTSRARAWAARRTGRAPWLTIARCLPYVLVAAAPALLPWLLSVMNRGAAVPWDVILSVWPPLPILVVVSAVSALAVVVARSLHVWRQDSGGTRRFTAEPAATS